MARDCDVLVVGAGPVGLLMAAELHRHGVTCRIIDKLTTPMNWVKALGVSQRTLELWDDLGIATEALDTGLLLRRHIVYVNQQRAVDADTEYPDEAPYRYPLSLPQPECERILTGHLARLGGQIERGVELQSFVETADGVRATLLSANGTETLECRYIVGCDGAHSTVRHQLQLPFEGGRFPMAFLLADVQLDWEFPHHAACLFMEVKETLDNLLVCIPYRDRSAPGVPRYRLSTMAQDVSTIDWEKPPPAESAPNPTLQQFQEAVRRFVPVPAKISDLRWSSVFRISHRLVPRYRVGRAFLAGDAGHIHPPTGGQGMNTGLQDAYNLAWKLALAIQGAAADDLLESYSAERQPVGEAVVSRTKQRTMSIGDRSQHDRDTLRDDAQLTVAYRDSKWVCEQIANGEALATGPRPGERAPDAVLMRPGLGVPVRLFDLFRGAHHTLLLYQPDEKSLHAAVALSVRLGDRLRVYRILAADQGVPADDLLPTVSDRTGMVRRHYDATPSSAYLIRPDGYVGYRTDAFDRHGADAYLQRVFRR